MIEQYAFGEVDGEAASAFELSNGSGLRAKVTSFGATLTELHVPDREGRLADVVLGFEDARGYAARGPYFGCTVGRVANRIALGKFELEGKSYSLAPNDPPHHLHGGVRGWDKRLWRVVDAHERNPLGPELVLEWVSADAEEGYPAEVRARVTYALRSRTLWIEMAVEHVNGPATLVNLANHSYWNLSGHAAGSVLAHELRLHCDEFTPGNPVVPDGRVEAVAGTAFDFRSPKAVGADIDAVGPVPAGYDHNFVVRGASDQLRPVAELTDPASGRAMRLSANQPGLQFYSGNFLDGSVVGKGGVRYGHRAGLCLETQAFPNAVNVPQWRGQVLLGPGQHYRHVMSHQFEAV